MGAIGIFLRGLAMGAADIVPGVSGGTIAFVTGIYEDLLKSLNSIGPSAWQAFRDGGIRKLWDHVNGGFLAVLLLGVATSILGLSHLVTQLLAEYPEIVWSFFFGLILASTWLVSRQMKRCLRGQLVE